jgi:peroxiredoxin
MFSSILLGMALISMAAPPVHADSRDWTLQDTKGEKFTLSDNLGGKPLVLVFWATWCTPCKKEMDEQRGLFDSLVEQGVNVILVSEDTQKSQAKVKPYVESKGYSWPVLLDPDGEVLKRYGGTSIPFTIVMDKEGTVQSKMRGAIKDADQFRSLVSGLTN